MVEYIDLSLEQNNDIKLLVIGQGDGTHKLAVTADLEVGDSVTISGVIILGASEAHVGNIGGEGINVSVSPTVTAGAYSAGDVVGGLLTFANASRVAGEGGVIKNIMIIDDAGQDAEMELWLFEATVSGIADNAAFAPPEADLRSLVAIISTGDGSWFACGTPSVARVEASQRYETVGTSLYGYLVTRGTPTFVATDDVTTIISILQD